MNKQHPCRKTNNLRIFYRNRKKVRRETYVSIQSLYLSSQYDSDLMIGGIFIVRDTNTRSSVRVLRNDFPKGISIITLSSEAII